MTDEEMAMKKATEKYPIPIRWKGIDLARNSCYEQGFLAGLKAGRLQWHKVADGDLPPIKIGCCSIEVLTDNGRFAYYYGDDNYWVDSHSDDEINTPKAWCVIPTFKEEAND